MKLTEKTLAAHKPPVKADYILHDAEITGFGLRVRGARRSWIFQYSIGSGPAKVTRRIKIGDYPALPPGKARKEAEDLHAKLHLHGDPAIERRKNRIEAGNTFAKLVQNYLDAKREQLRPRSFGELRRHLEINAKPLHHLAIAAIDQSIIARHLAVLAKRGSVTANRTRASMAAMFTWAICEGRALTNPAASVKPRKEKARDRVLDDHEIRVLWGELGDDDYSTILKLLLLTGARAGEIAGLKWSEIDFDRNLICLPPERTKNGRAHDVPMAGEPARLLKSRHRSDDRNFIFGYGPRGFNGWSTAKSALDEKLAKTSRPLAHWVPHDLRRSVATGLQRLGVRFEVTEAVLNHVSGSRSGVAGIYQRHDWADEKAQALTAWNAHVLALVEDRGKALKSA